MGANRDVTHDIPAGQIGKELKHLYLRRATVEALIKSLEMYRHYRSVWGMDKGTGMTEQNSVR
jgi:hypothetical protein